VNKNWSSRALPHSASLLAIALAATGCASKRDTRPPFTGAAPFSKADRTQMTRYQANIGEEERNLARNQRNTRADERDLRTDRQDLRADRSDLRKDRSISADRAGKPTDVAKPGITTAKPEITPATIANNTAEKSQKARATQNVQKAWWHFW
jgi:hypothetical protein